MRYWTLIKGNIRRQKGSFIGVLLLMFIITASLCAVLSVWNNSNSYEVEQMERLGVGDAVYWVADVPDMEELTETLQNVSDVEKVAEQPFIYANYYVNGQKVTNTGLLMEYETSRYEYYIFNENLTGIDQSPMALEKGEVYAAPVYCSMYDAKIGDTIELELTENGGKQKYTIKGFFEDPFMGGSMMGMKTILMCESDIEEISGLIEAQEEKTLCREGSILHIFKTDDSRLSGSEFQSVLNQVEGLKAYVEFTYSKSAIQNFMLILQNIFAAFLMLFVIVLLIVAMIVIGHSISSNIEQDYVDMGILKAVGFTGKTLRHLQIVQYLLAIGIGMIFGIPLSVQVAKLVNSMTVTATGLMPPSVLPVGLSAAALCGILLLLVGFICIKTITIERIKPIRAIRGGSGDVYFKSRFTMPIQKKCLSLWLAVRQLVSGKKQYISAGLITILLVYFLSLVGRVEAWMGPGGEGMMKVFSAAEGHMAVWSPEHELTEEAEQFIASHTKIERTYQLNTVKAAINNIDFRMNIISNPEYYNILSGRTCKYDNELVIAEMAAKELGVGIGDTVTVSYKEKQEDFIITGINQCSEDMGANFSINQEGYQRLSSDMNIFFDYYVLEDPSLTTEILNELEEKYGERIVVKENEWSGIESIVSAMSALGILIYIIVIIFILVVIFMTGGRILFREQRDLGIYKSLGFVSQRLRLMFALRFGLAALVGSVFGIILSALGTDVMAAPLFRMCGIGGFSSHLTPIGMILPAVEVVLLFLIFAYGAAGKIKKVEPQILIVE